MQYDNHSVIGYNGVVNRTDYTYAPVDGRDDGSLSGETARTVVKSVGSDLSGWTEVSRTYYAEFVEDGRRVAVSERAACAGAAYGADGSLRTTTVYHWKDANAGLPCERIAEDGLVTRYAYTLSGLARTTESFTAPADATNGVPFKTTVSRAVANDKYTEGSLLP